MNKEQREKLKERIAFLLDSRSDLYASEVDTLTEDIMKEVDAYIGHLEEENEDMKNEIYELGEKVQ